MSRRKSLPGARWKPDTQNFDRDLAYRYDCGQLNELEMAIYATIKERSKKWPRAEIVEVWADAYQMTQADIAGESHWATLTKEEKFAFARERARTNTNKAMRIDDGMRVNMWQMKGDEAHIALKIGGSHYPLDEQRDSVGQYAERPKDKPPEIEEEFYFDEPDESEFEPEEFDIPDDDDSEELFDYKELVPVELSEIERIESRDNAEYQEGSARLALENAPEGSPTLLPTEIGNELPPPGLSEDSTADDDDKRSPSGIEDVLENTGCHLSYRPDWIKCHEEEARVIAKLYVELHPESDEAKRLREQEDAETEYETLVRILGADDADWLWEYEWNKTGSNQRTRPAATPADRSRACRLRKKVMAAAEAARPTGQAVSAVSVTTRALSERDTNSSLRPESRFSRQVPTKPFRSTGSRVSLCIR